MKMKRWIKNAEALVRGYLFFTVNGKVFLLYSSANDACDAVPQDKNVKFRGLHIWKGWRGFFYRDTPELFVPPTDEQALAETRRYWMNARK